MPRQDDKGPDPSDTHEEINKMLVPLPFATAEKAMAVAQEKPDGVPNVRAGLAQML
jgi:hypothetical protein